MDSEAIWVAIIMSAGSIISSVLALIVSKRNSVKIEQVHIATNSMKDALVAAALITGKAEGVKEEKARNELLGLKIEEGIKKHTDQKG